MKIRMKRFTLLEVMIVLMLLVILAGAVTPAYMNYLKKAKLKTAKNQCMLISDAVDHYYLDIGNYPTVLEALVRNADGDDGWKGPYLKGNLPKDPWGNSYLIAVPGRTGTDFDIVCLGADGKAGGEGDAADIYSSDPVE